MGLLLGHYTKLFVTFNILTIRWLYHAKQKLMKEILLPHGIDQKNGAGPIDGNFSAAAVHPDLPSTITWNGISVAIDAYNTNYANDHDKIKSVWAVEDRRLVFLSEGARNIKEYVERFFSFRQYTIILDWYHLEKKTRSS